MASLSFNATRRQEFKEEAFRCRAAARLLSYGTQCLKTGKVCKGREQAHEQPFPRNNRARRPGIIARAVKWTYGDKRRSCIGPHLGGTSCIETAISAAGRHPTRLQRPADRAAAASTRAADLFL